MRSLLLEHPFPRYSAIRDEECAPAFRSLCQDVLHPAISKLEEAAASWSSGGGDSESGWEAIWKPHQRIVDRLARAYDVVDHLNTVRCSEALTIALREMQENKSGVLHRLGGSSTVRDAFSALATKLELKKHQDEELKMRERLVMRRLDEMNKITGKPGDSSGELIEIVRELMEERRKYGENLMKAASAFSYEVKADEPEKTRGIPQSVLTAAQQEYGWRFALPHWPVVMKHAEHPETREGMGKARLAMARENLPVVLRMLQLRREQARLLGYNSYADMVCSKRMAQSVENVKSFLVKCRTDECLLQQARHETQQLRETFESSAQNHEQNHDVMSYAHASFYTNQLTHKQGQNNDAASLPSVEEFIAELSLTATKLFGVSLQRDMDVEEECSWHPSVIAFAVKNTQQNTEAVAAREENERSSNERVMGYVFFDLYRRESKAQVAPAWVAKAQSRSRLFPEQAPVSYRLPLIHLCANLESGQPVDATSAICIFHEFGHALHYVLSEAEDEACGYEGIEWDAVEIPSYFMEHWARENRNMTKADTPVPSSSALDQLRQIQFGLADMALHSANPPSTEKEMIDVIQGIALSTQYAFAPDAFCPEEAYYPCYFSHLFTGDYAATYYGYLWASKMADKAFAHVKEDPESKGRNFRQEFLARGSSRHPMDSFCAFLDHR